MSDDKQGLRQEYSEVNNYYRHYSALRFVMFSVYFAVTAGIASVAFGVVEIKSFGATLISGMEAAALQPLIFNGRFIYRIAGT